MAAAVDETGVRRLLESPDIIGLGVRADEVRRQRHARRTTFVRVLEVHVEAVPAMLPGGLSAGEIRLTGSPASLDAAVAAVRGTAALAGSVPVTGFSLADVRAIAGGRIADACAALAAAGLAGIAEVQADRIEPGDEDAVAAARGAGLLVARLTVERPPAGDPLDAILRACALQEAAGGFRVFAPLPRRVPADAPTTGYDDVRQVAAARLLAAGIESIQVDWPLYGPKLAQFALTVGASDVDGVSAVDPGTLGTRRSPIEEIRGNIRAASLEPVERNARFEEIGA